MFARGVIAFLIRIDELMLSRKRDRYRYVGPRREGQPAYPLRRVVRVDIEPMVEPTQVLVCHEPLVVEAVRFIAANVRQDLQIEDVANYLNTSRSTLIRRFDAALGRSVASEIRRQRVAQLKRLLTQTGRPIAEISSAYGFSSPGQLSRYFKRAVGVSPGDYRRGRVVPTGAVVYRGS